MPILTKNAKYTKCSIFLSFSLYSYLCKVFTTKIVIFQRFFWKKSCKLFVDLLYWAALYSKSITVKVSNKAVKVGKLSKINKRKVTPIRERRVRSFLTNLDPFWAQNWTFLDSLRSFWINFWPQNHC